MKYVNIVLGLEHKYKGPTAGTPSSARQNTSDGAAGCAATCRLAPLMLLNAEGV